MPAGGYHAEVTRFSETNFIFISHMLDKRMCKILSINVPSYCANAVSEAVFAGPGAGF